jgi:hypothetical protein
LRALLRSQSKQGTIKAKKSKLRKAR